MPTDSIPSQAQMLKSDAAPARRSPMRRRWQMAAILTIVALAPLLILITFFALGSFEIGGFVPSLRSVLFIDLLYVLFVAALVSYRLKRLLSARRERSAGARLHLRLSALFALIALIPAITVAVFAFVTINIGLEGWFSERVRNVVDNSRAAAEAYQYEQERNLTQDAQAVAAVLDRARARVPFLSDGDTRQVLIEAQASIQRGLRVAFIIDGTGDLRLRGERSYLFDFVRPSDAEIAQARADGIALIKDWPSSEFRALVPLGGYLDRLLYVSRSVDGEILNLLDETQVTIQRYNELETERGQVLTNFGLLYLAFALILILAAVLLGMWFAEGLSRPVGRLAAAAERVGAGDLEAQVEEERGDDEIATMGRVFNQMTRQLKGQRDALLQNTRQIEERRRLFDSVLSSVTAGVVGLDAHGRVDFVNRSAETLTEIDADSAQHQPLDTVVPEFGPLLTRLQAGEGAMMGGRVQDEVRISRSGGLENLLVRVAERRTAAGKLEGYVVAFDDVTQLVSAQRMAAWGDVARRIAHEIKNPLTPIQLSADRIRRKFGRQLPEDEAESLQALTDVIVRQTNDLRRIVDEFSRFARMPEPDRRPTDLIALVRDALTLQEAGQERVTFDYSLPGDPLMVDIDATMISQALTNLLKNAGEAIEGFEEAGRAPQGFEPRIQLTMAVDDSRVTLLIADNGIGLPEDSARLFEPYVTTRENGTGLGLPIVKKIIEEHGGTLKLRRAPVFEGGTHHGALAEIILPRLRTARGGPKEDGTEV